MKAITDSNKINYNAYYFELGFKAGQERMRTEFLKVLGLELKSNNDDNYVVLIK